MVESGENATADDGDRDHAKPASKKSCSIPLVELSLQNVTYAPITAQNSFKSKLAASQSKRTTVLHQVSTTIRPYTLTGWLGPSGAGKSSLLQVAADYVASSDLHDDSLITVNGEEGRIPKRLVGVVWQDDLLLSNLTVQENVWFTARLKTPHHVSDDKVRTLVDETLQELGLWHVRESPVGNPLGGVAAKSSVLSSRRGISGGERKRVAVANELVVRPSVLLLDEPTSGLDATTAASLMETLRQLARRGGHTIAAVIHQPRTTIFQSLDHVLMLSKGYVVYDGPPAAVRNVFEQCATVSPLPPETGIADWLMDVITQDEKDRTDSTKPGSLAVHWKAHGADYVAKWKANQVIDDQEADDGNMLEGNTASSSSSVPNEKPQLERKNTLNELEMLPKYSMPFLAQLRLLTQRTFKQQRGERLTSAAVLLQCFYLFATSLLWWQIPDDTSGVYTRNSLLFFMMIAQANSIVTSTVAVFQRERTLLRRERAKKLYSVGAYFLGKTAADMTNNVLLPLLYCMIVYWTAGYRASAAAYGRFILSFYLIFSTAQSMGLCLSVALPSMELALVLSPPTTLFFMIIGGFYIPLDSLHAGVSWLSWLSFARYGYSAVVVNEYEDRSISCGGDDAAITIGGGSGECPLLGESVLDSLGIRDIGSSYWFNIGMLALLQVFFRVASYILLRRSK